jgi:hypothetical protein
MAFCSSLENLDVSSCGLSIVSENLSFFISF